MTESKTTIYFDEQDPSDCGWAWRTRHSDGSEESGSIDDDAIVSALDAIVSGEVPTPNAKASLKGEYFGALLDDVGELFPGEARTFYVADECDTWTEDGDSADAIAAMLMGRTASEAGYDADMPLAQITYEIQNHRYETLLSVTVDFRLAPSDR